MTSNYVVTRNLLSTLPPSRAQIDRVNSPDRRSFDARTSRPARAPALADLGGSPDRDCVEGSATSVEKAQIHRVLGR